MGYVSRFARDLRTAVNARHDLHARGAVILFADERVLSSDEASFAVVRRAYELASAGLTDRVVGAATGLALKHVAEILTNPFYAGRLWSGEPSALSALIDPGTWEQVQAMRARYSRRHRGSLNRRQYALGGSWPARRAAGGSSGTSAGTATPTPARRSRPPPPAAIGAKTSLDHRVKGESYKSDRYEAAIGRAFEHVPVSAGLKAAAVAEATRPEPGDGDGLALARINRERDQAALRFARDRDLAGSRRRWRASTRRPKEPSSARHGPRRPRRRAPTSRRCRSCGRGPRTPDATLSPRRPMRGSTSWG